MRRLRRSSRKSSKRAATCRTCCAASATRLQGCAHSRATANTCAIAPRCPAACANSAILALARGNQYAWTHHAPFALKEGVTQKELDRLNGGTLASTLSAPERAAIDYAREFALGGNVSDATFARLRREFDERGITDLTLLCGYFIALASVINALRIELEPDRKPMMKPVS